MLLHDLKNPLFSAKMAFDLVLRDPQVEANLTPERQKTRDAAFSSLQRLEEMLGDLLNLAKAEAGVLTLERNPRDVREIVHAAVLAVLPRAESNRITLTEIDLQTPVSASVDGKRIRRVLDNLLANALRYTPEGGSIRVGVTMELGEARVAVEDTGPGVPAALRKRVFDKYGQAEAVRRGSRTSVGLGLTYCKLIIEAHGGRIWVAFVFSLPVEGAGPTPVSSDG
jgi:signal transduction histidine kinase